MGTLFNVDAGTGNLTSAGSASFTGNITTSGSITSTSTTSGFLLPKMTTTQRNAIVSPATGLQIFNTTTNQIEFYNGSTWAGVGGGGGTINPGTLNHLAWYSSGTTIDSSNFLINNATGAMSIPGQLTMGASSIDMNSNKIINLLDPTSTQDAATKNYIDIGSNNVNLLKSNGGFESWPINTSYTINTGTVSFQNGWFANWSSGQTNHTASRTSGVVDTGVYALDMFGDGVGTANWYVYYPVSNYAALGGKKLSYSARLRVDAGSAGLPGLFAGFYDGVNTNVTAVVASASYQTISGSATVTANPTQLWFVVGFAPSGFSGLGSAYLPTNTHCYVDSCKLVVGSIIPTFTIQDNRGAVQQSATTGVTPTVGIGGGTLIGTVTIAATGTPIKITGMVDWVNTASSGSSGNEIWIRNVTRGDSTALNGSYVNPGVTNGLTAGSINQVVTTVETYDCPNAGNVVYEFRMSSTAGSATSVNRFSFTAREEDE